MLQQAAPGGCGNPVPGSVQAQIGWGPRQRDLVFHLAVGNPAWALELHDPSGPFQPNPFYDSVISVDSLTCTLLYVGKYI